MSVDLSILDSIQFPTLLYKKPFYLHYEKQSVPPSQLVSQAILSHPDNANQDHRKVLFVNPNLIDIFSSFQTALLHGSDVTLVLNNSSFTPAPRGKTKFVLKTDKSVTIFPIHGKTNIKLYQNGQEIDSGILDISGNIYQVKGTEFEIEVDKEVLVGIQWDKSTIDKPSFLQRFINKIVG